MRLPALPERCRAAVAHARLEIGMNPVVVLRLEREQLDTANAAIADCAAHYDGLRRKLGGG